LIFFSKNYDHYPEAAGNSVVKKALATLPQAQQGLLTKTNRSMRKTFRVIKVM